MRQWKQETLATPNDNEDSLSGWASDRSARVKKGTPGRVGRPGGDWESKTMDNAVFYNSLPPGSDGADQEMADIRKMRTTTPGTDDVTTRATPEAFSKGFVRSPMRPTDQRWDAWNSEPFYRDAEVDGKVGFAERGNVSDRY